MKISVRNLKRQKLYSTINIIGLSIGFAAAIMIILFVMDEFNFDKFNHDYDRIARLITAQRDKVGSLQKYSLTSGILGQRLKSEFPEIVDYAEIIDKQSCGRFTVRYGQNKYYESKYLITQPAFFRIFDFKVLEGNRSKLLSEPNEMVLTQSAAKKLFGNEDPVGKIIKSDKAWGNFKVTGILKDPPLDSHLQFNMLISFESLNKYAGAEKRLGDLNYSLVRTYLLFKEGYNINNFTGKLNEFQELNKSKRFGVTDRISLQPLKDIHFHSQNIEFDLNADSRSETTIYILGIIGLLLILVAVVNYTNLTTAKSINKIKEIGVRRVVGAAKRQLIYQFIMESFVITAIAMVIAFLIVELTLPLFNNFTGKSLSLFGQTGISEIAVITMLTLLISLLSGLLPAVIITKFKTVIILKGKLPGSSGFSNFGKSLVIAQFVVSIMMIFCTVTIYKQMKYIQSKNLGFNKNNLLVIDINSSGARNNFREMKTEFAKDPDVESITVTSRIPGDWKDISELKVRNLGDNNLKEHKMYYIGADYEFLNTFGINIIQGRNFYQSYSGDSTVVIINKKAASVLGLKNPVGKSVAISGGTTAGIYQIIGVAEDFNFQSLHEKISPMIIGYWNNPFTAIDYFTARIDGKNIQKTLHYLSAAQQKFDNVTPFEFNFLDERIKDFYVSDEREAIIIDFAAVLALLIACMDLFGLAAVIAEKKTKEIGVRKVLGASVPGIVILFSRDFMKLILFTNLIALPLAYYLMQKWFSNFAYKINIGISIFLASGIIGITIAVMTIIYQAVKAATANPVKSLRYE